MEVPSSRRAMFRSESIAHHADRLSGEVSVAIPVSWQAVGYLVCGSVAAGFAFLAFAGYARVETVTGTLLPAGGVSFALPTRAGVVTAVHVHDGQVVVAGTTLVTIRTEEDSASGLSAASQVAAAITRQDAGLNAQEGASIASYHAQQFQILAQRQGLSAEISELLGQIQLQEELIASAQKDIERTRVVAERGYISGRDLQLREESLLLRQQGLSQLVQSLASRRAALSESGRRASQLSAQSRVQSASIAAARADVAQAAANVAGLRAYVLRAAVAGRVTALTARTGQGASPQIPLMAIVPAGSVLRGELAVPSSAIGFVKLDQEVRLAVDAFPYQRFGTVNAKVVIVARSAVGQLGPNNMAVSVYPVTVALDGATISAYGKQHALVSGMTLTARIVTEKQSSARWLFEPLFAVRKR